MFRIVFTPLLALSLAATSLSAQDTVRASAGGKSPTVARVIGIVPGAGHVYAGEPLRGLAHFGTTAGIFMLAGLMLASDCIGAENCGESSAPALMMVAGFGYWGWTIYDAGRAVERTSGRFRPLRMSLIAAPVGSRFGDGTQGRGVKVGLAVDRR
ncbi:MAG: hypothetical protein ABR499_08850 [Gemmatimonadaceae bacterium]